MPGGRILPLPASSSSRVSVVDGFILAGGSSRRMGTDKAALRAAGGTLLEQTAAELEPVVSSLFLVGGSDRGSGLPVLADAVAGLGPAAGILTALRNGREWCLIVACDMPGLRRGLFSRLLERARDSEADCVVPVDPEGRRHPLCALYHVRCLPQWESAVARGIRAVNAIADTLHVECVEVENSGWLRNVNTPADWQDYLNAK